MKMAHTNYCWTLCVVMATVSSLQAELVDLSHSHNETTLMAPNTPQFEYTTLFDGEYLPGVYVKAGSYGVGEHGGTHMDAPIHLNREGRTLDQIPLGDTIADGVMIDCTDETSENSQYALTVDKLEEWENENGEIPKGAAVIVNFNWSHKFDNATLYFNTDTFNDTATYKFPHVSKEAAEWLVDERDLKILAVDVAGPDGYQKPFHVHDKLLGQNRIIVENLKDPGRLPAKGFRFYAAPVKFVGASGVQVRAFAVTHEVGNQGTKPSGWSVSVVGLVFVVLFSRLFPFV